MQDLTAANSPSASFYIAKSPVCVDAKGQSVGKGVFATRDFNAGDQFASFKRPLVGSLDSQFLQTTCSNCYVWTEASSTGTRLYVSPETTVQKCAGCQRFRYCSKICQKEAWQRGHKHECKSLRNLVGKVMPKAVLATMELLTRRKHGLIADEEWESLCSLQTHIDDFKQNGTYGNIELMAMGASHFSLTQNMFNKDFVAAMYARVLTNSLTLITPTLDPLGIIIDATLGHINHSCDSNAFVMMDGASVSIRLLRPVKKDEEIFISYVDTTNPYDRRQSELESRWFFTCKCSKCKLGTAAERDEWLAKPKSLEKQSQETADDSLKQIVSTTDADSTGQSLEERRLSALQARLFESYEQAQRQPPDEAITTIQKAMQVCHSSGLYPIYKQPYASLRDDLIVNLLSAGKHTEAWSHCAKRYKYILPKLHTVPFHPVRVVQIWQMAMLATYLGSTPEGISAPGVNMGLIAMMLVKQVLDASAYSHGVQSAFAKSVKGKAEEMIEELKRSLGGKVDQGVMDAELERQKEMLIQMGDWAVI